MNRQQRIEAFLLAAHRLAAARLREDPRRRDDVRAQLARWRRQNGPTRSDPYWDEWERLLALDADAFERAICAENERATVLRSVSPISAVISQRERMQMLKEAGLR